MRRALVLGERSDQAMPAPVRVCQTGVRVSPERAGGGLAGSLDTLRRHILDNFPRIEQTLTKAIKGILALGDNIGRLFFRLIEGTSDLITWWKSLDKQTRELISLFGGLTIALRILNSTFWMSPVGLITATSEVDHWRESGRWYGWD